MRGKDLLLLLKYTSHLLLEGKELLLVITTHGSLHSIDVLPHFLLILAADYVLYLNLLLNLLCLLDWSDFWRRSGLLYGVGSVLVLVQQHFLNLFSVFYLFYLFRNVFRHCFGCLLRLWWLFFFERIDYFRWQFIGAYFRLQDLFAILRRLWWSIIW